MFQIEEEDRTILRLLVSSLTERELKAVFLRFWGPLSIEEIARELRMSWDNTDRVINFAIQKLKNHCCQNPRFYERYLSSKAA